MANIGRRITMTMTNGSKTVFGENEKMWLGGKVENHLKGAQAQKIDGKKGNLPAYLQVSYCHPASPYWPRKAASERLWAAK